jgi:anti-sigma regulatory factor (Ser/Thr protein kinase)
MLIEVSEPSQAGEARRKAMALAEELQLGETSRGAVALATTEMATNLVKHAGRGHILVQRILRSKKPGVRVISVDKGPGIGDVSRALADGHSSTNSMGAGLGAIQRLSDSFDLYSIPGSGTVVSAEFWQEKARETSSAPLEVGVVSEPIRNEIVCGDGWGVRGSLDTAMLMVVDGLGHGELASDAAREAERILSAAKQDSLCEIVQDTHAALRKTRGAALAIAKIQFEKKLLSFAGVGNISASIVAMGSSRSIPSHNGIVGHQMSRVQEFTYPWNSDSILVMHSDGMGTHWTLEDYPGIWSKHPSVIAAILHRDFCRGRDDVTVLVAKAGHTSTTRS